MRAINIHMSDLSYSLSFALKRGYKVLKINVLVSLAFLVTLLTIQIWQESNNPVIKTTYIKPYSVVGDKTCFLWDFEIKRPSELTSTTWTLKSEKERYFNTPIVISSDIKEPLSEEMFSIGKHSYILCATAPKDIIEIHGVTIFKVWILGIPWSNSYSHTVRFR